MTGTARTVQVERQRLDRWLHNFSARHGSTQQSRAGDTVLLVAEDGAEARLTVPFPPLAGPDSEPAAQRLVDHVLVDRRVGALLVRRGGFAVGVFDGSRLIASKVGSGYVQARTKAGGWSQQRYARRRDNQAHQLYDRAAAVARTVLLPAASSLDAVVTGGDRSGVAAVLEDPRLAPLARLVVDHFVPTPDPRLQVLQTLPTQFLAVRVDLNELA